MARTKQLAKETNLTTSKTKEGLDEKSIKLTLNSEQIDIVRRSVNDAISIFIGKPGSGKTLLGVYIAMYNKLKKESDVNRIVITRPTVSDEQLGFLPGDVKDKLDPWMQPVYQNMYQCINKQEVIKMIDKNEIEICPIAYMRGRTIGNAIIIADEIQNLTKKQMEMLIGRLGKGSRMILCGDTSQVDLKNKKDSGLQYLIDLVENIKDVNVYELKTNHRHPVLDLLLDKFNNNNDIKKSNVNSSIEEINNIIEYK
jgi:phosphate starvation-inducible PhoH-like protein